MSVSAHTLVLATTRPDSRLRYLWLAGFLLFGMAVQSFGHGCPQCLDATLATPPAVQAAYRQSAYLVGGFGLTVFAAGTLLLRRNR